MTLYDFGTNTAQKRLNMAAILKFKMAAEDAFEKKWNQLRFCLQGYKDAKKPWFHYIGNFALDYITHCTIYSQSNECASVSGAYVGAQH